MSSEPRTLDDLETPAAVVDIARMDANLARTAGYCRAHELAWRPHAKTHKSPLLAARQRDFGAVGVTVATVREAEVMAGAVDDLLVAYPVFGDARLQRLMRLPEQVRLTVGLDSLEALRALGWAARVEGRTVGVLVEMDMGMGRVGVQTPGDAIALATEAENLPGLEYRGVMYYPGHIRLYGAEQEGPLAVLAERLSGFVEALDAAGLGPGIVSGGSTPTLWNAHRLPPTNEVRPGTSIFNDRNTVEQGACAWEEVAYSVLATVVSTAVPGQAVVDAGSKALVREALGTGGGGFGALLERPEVVVKGLSEEHGVLDLSASDWEPRLGEKVRIVPNHVCVSVNLQETLWGVKEEEIVEAWPVIARGRSPFRV